MDVARDIDAAVAEAEPPRRGPRPRHSVDDVVDAAIAIADADGLDAVTMRAVAERLGTSPMSLYTYIPGKAELLDLMLDALYLAMARKPFRLQWRARLRAVAEANRELYARHPWAARISTARPPLGPGLMAKYEYELAAFDGLGLSDIEMDAALTFLLAFVQETRSPHRSTRTRPEPTPTGGRRPARCSRGSSIPSVIRSRHGSAAPRAPRRAAPTTRSMPTRSGSSGCSTASPRSSTVDARVV